MSNWKHSRTPPIRTLVIRVSNYPDRLGPSGKYEENSTKITCLEIIGFRIKYCAMLWLMEFQNMRGRKFYIQAHTININIPTSNCQRSIFSKKNSITRIFCLSQWFAFPINTDKLSSTVISSVKYILQEETFSSNNSYVIQIDIFKILLKREFKIWRSTFNEIGNNYNSL